jgi:gephyrin
MWGLQEGVLDGIVTKAVADGADVIVTSGGVSMGDTDLVKPMLERMGKVHFGRVLMKPGKPLTFATLSAPQDRSVLFFGLPGAASVPCMPRMHLQGSQCLRCV